MPANTRDRHHVRVGHQIFCTLEWLERPEDFQHVAAIRCPHHAEPLRRVQIHPRMRAPARDTGQSA